MLAHARILDFLTADEIARIAWLSKEHWQSVHDLQAVQLSIRQGRMPNQCRKAYWKHCLQGKIDYTQPLAAAQNDPELEYTQEEILKDLPRTYLVSQDPSKKDPLLRMLLAGAVQIPEIGYCQGINFVAAVFLEVMGEAEGFPQYIAMIERFGLRRIFVPGLPDVPLREFQMNHYIHKHLPQLFAHFREHSVTCGFFMARWFMTIFAVYLPLETVVRVWDCFFLDGWPVIFKVGVAVLSEVQQTLLGLDLGGISIYIRDNARIHHADYSSLLKRAYSIQVTEGELAELEDAYYVKQAGEQLENLDGTHDPSQVLLTAKLKVEKYESLAKIDIGYYKTVLEDLEKKLYHAFKDYARLHPQIAELERRIEVLCDLKSSLSQAVNAAQLASIDTDMISLTDCSDSRVPEVTCVLRLIQPSSSTSVTQDPALSRHKLAALNKELKWLQQQHCSIVRPSTVQRVLRN